MKNILLLAFVFLSNLGFAQVKIGDNPTTIGTSSILELESTNKALLVTRVADTTAITTAVDGMIIYDFSSQCFRGHQAGYWSPCMVGSNAAAVACTTPDAFVVPAATTITAGDMVNTTATGGTNGTVTWAVSPTAGVSPTTGSGLTTGNITFTTVGTYTLTYTSTNNSTPASCSPAASVTGTRTITVNAAACTTPDAFVVPAATTITAGDMVNTTATGGTNGTVTWAVSPTAGVSPTTGSGLTTGNITFTTVGTYTLTYTSTNNSTPASCSPAASVTRTRTITVNAAAVACTTPDALVVPAATTITFGDMVNTTATGGTNGTVTWAVSPTAGVSPTTGSGLTTGNITFATEGSYTLTYTSTNNSTPASCSPAASVTRTRTITVTDGIPTVVSTTGKIWMDRNLGATQVATSSTDAASYGDLYQWGRKADGHQIRTSSVTAGPVAAGTEGANFISNGTAPNDWLTVQDDTRWQTVGAANNPCPSGYRVPTYIELNNERLKFTTNNTAGAYGSVLKLPAAGERFYGSGNLSDVGSYGFYWSSSVLSTYARALAFTGATSGYNTYGRSHAFSVRCIKD